MTTFVQGPCYDFGIGDANIASYMLSTRKSILRSSVRSKPRSNLSPVRLQRLLRSMRM